VRPYYTASLVVRLTENIYEAVIFYAAKEELWMNTIFTIDFR
jgi:hypothetical protein